VKREEAKRPEPTCLRWATRVGRGLRSGVEGDGPSSTPWLKKGGDLSLLNYRTMGDGGRLTAARFSKLALAISVLLFNIVGICAAAEQSPVRGEGSTRRDASATLAIQVPYGGPSGAVLPDWIQDRTGGPSNESTPVRIPGPRSFEDKDFIPATTRRSSSCSQVLALR